MTPEEIVKEVAKKRRVAGLSQQGLANAAGLKQSAIARLESGKFTPQVDTLVRVLEPLGYTIGIVPKQK